MINEFDERIIRYYDKDLSVEEAKAFELELQENSDLKKEFDFYGTLIEGIKTEGALELKEYIKEHIKSEEIEEQSNLWMYAAASIAFLLLSYFAIYSYLETGNIKEAAEIITLKDQKSSKFKFWKKNNSTVNSKFIDSTSAYKDSMLSLEQSRQTDTLLKNAIAAVEPIAEDINDLNLSASVATESTKDALSVEQGMFDQDEAIALTQVILIPIKLKETENSESSTSAQAVNPSSVNRMKELTPTKKSIPRITSSEGSVLEKINGKDSLDSKTQSKAIPTFSKFKLQNFEDEKGEVKISISKGKNPSVLEITLFNIWGVNPLIFEISGSYYLDLGPSGPWVEKSGSGIWKIPNNTGVFYKIEWVKNKQIIEQIRN